MVHFSGPLSAALAALALCAACQAHADQLVIVVGAASSAPKLTGEQVSAIFLGSVKSFPNGEKAIPIDQTAGSPAYAQFYSQVAGRSEAQIKAYWSRMVFTGKGAPPQEAGDGAAVKKLVSSNPNLIGYIDATQVDSSVKVLAEIK